MKRKLIAIALVLMMLLALAPSMALADEMYFSVGGKAFTEFGQTISVGGGTAKLTEDSKDQVTLELNNVKITSFDEMEDGSGTVYKCGIVVSGVPVTRIIAKGNNSITAPSDRSDAVYEGIYIENAASIADSTIDIKGMDIGIDLAGDSDIVDSKLTFRDCDISLLDQRYELLIDSGSTVNISGNGSMGIMADQLVLHETAFLNIKLEGEGQPARYGIFADKVIIAGQANIEAAIKNVDEAQDVVVNAICATYGLSVENCGKSYLKANVSAENCPSAVAVAIVAPYLYNYADPGEAYCGRGTIDANAKVSGDHAVAQAISCENMDCRSTVKAQVIGASADDCAVSVTWSAVFSNAYLYASVDAKDSNYGAVVLPATSGDSADKYGSLYIMQPDKAALKDITVDAIPYQIVADESGAPVNCVFANSYGYKFTDITALNDSYKAAIAWASESGVTGGYPDFTFRPGNTCTRAQVVTFLWRANGCPEPAGTGTGFSDVPKDMYYYKAVLWASENGITSGFGDGGFHPDETVTRAQAMTFIWRSEGKPAAPKGTVNEFNDVSEANYYYDAVLWAVANGITGGYGNGQFGSMDGCTRAQIVTFLHRNIA